MALAMRSSTGFRVTRDLLATYLGRDASDRVTNGDIQRGAVGEIDACLLYADLRGFTDYAEATPPATVAERLNSYLDCMGAPVEEQGGQILKFLGDGLLAVFIENGAVDRTSVCAAALTAAEEILQRIATLNADAASSTARTLSADIALHKGQVLYGNVGTAQRLDFAGDRSGSERGGAARRPVPRPRHEPAHLPFFLRCRRARAGADEIARPASPARRAGTARGLHLPLADGHASMSLST